MKTIALLTSMIMTMTSFTSSPVLPKDAITSSEKLAEYVVAAFRANSPGQYAQLFPSLTEFHHLMERNGVVYGRFLDEAKKEFSMEYQQELLPELKDSFEKIIEEGRSRGIDWSSITLKKVEPEITKGFLPTIPVTFSFTSNGKEYRLQIERVIMIGNEYRITQYIRFV
jgi:hypothetical protein